MKNVTRSVLCAVTAAYLAITGSVIAGGDSDSQMIKIIRDDASVTVHSNDGIVTEIPKDILADEEQLRSYLTDLDEKTLEMVIDLLTGMTDDDSHFKVMKLHKFMEKMHGADRKVLVIGEDHVNLDLEGHQIFVDSDVEVSPEINIKKIKELHGVEKHVIVNINDDEAHKKSILSMLKKGDFTQEQLDEIQQALDSKR